jgi:hypothetical protein
VRRGIPPFSTAETRRASTIEWESVDLGQRPDSIIAHELGVGRRKVCYERRKRHLPAFVGLVLSQEGEPCRSIYEAMYDAWLHDSLKAHEHEVRIPRLPLIADFWVDGEYIEIVGMTGFRRYREKHEAKRWAYEAARLPVQWLYPSDVEALFATCSLQLRFRSERTCADCGRQTHDLVKGVCRVCYMPRWRKARPALLTCPQCGNEFATREPRRFCSRSCYWSSLELEWPAWDELERRVAEKPIRQVAVDLGVRPGTLYMRLSRRRQRQEDAQCR